MLMGGPPSFSLQASLELPTITKESVLDGSAWVQLKTEHIRRYGEQIARQLAGDLHVLPPSADVDTADHDTEVEEPGENCDSDDEQNAGSVVHWAEDRGFGFIQDKHTGERVFFHASALAYPDVDRAYLTNNFGTADFDDLSTIHYGCDIRQYL